MAERKRAVPIIRRQTLSSFKVKAKACRFTFSSLPGWRFQMEARVFPVAARNTLVAARPCGG